MSQLNCTYFLGHIFDKNLVIIAGMLLLLAVTFFVLRANGGVYSFAGLVLLWLGGYYNLYQRVVYNCVSDNMDFLGLFMFNLADLCVTAGIVIITLGIFKNGKKNSHN